MDSPERILFRPTKAEYDPVSIEDEWVIKVGTLSSAHLRLTEAKGVSRMHAYLKYEDEGWSVSDLGSAHGTYVNGKHVNKAFLASGDLVKFGRNSQAEFRVIIGDDIDKEGSYVDSPSPNQERVGPSEQTIREAVDQVLREEFPPKNLKDLKMKLGLTGNATVTTTSVDGKKVVINGNVSNADLDTIRQKLGASAATRVVVNGNVTGADFSVSAEQIAERDRTITSQAQRIDELENEVEYLRGRIAELEEEQNSQPKEEPISFDW